MTKRSKLPLDDSNDDKSPSDYEPVLYWRGDEEFMSCNNLGCEGDCNCYEAGFDAGQSETLSSVEEANNDEIVVTLYTAGREVERIFRERILALDGEEIFKGDKLAGSESARLRSLWEKVKRVFE